MLSYQDVAFRTAWVITGDAAEAEDATQNAFVKAYFALGRFHQGAPFRPWLLQIVANESRNRRMADSRHPTIALDDIGVDMATDQDPSPEALALAGEDRARLVDALNCLREEDRTIVVYRYLLELSEAEMASALGIRQGTVKSRLSRAMARLREQMSSAAPDASAWRSGDD